MALAWTKSAPIGRLLGFAVPVSALMCHRPGAALHAGRTCEASWENGRTCP